MTTYLPASNPFARPSALDLELPDFAAISDDDFLPAIRAGIEQARDEVTAIAENPDEPTFDNTVGALERAGQLLARVRAVLFNLISADGTDDRIKLESEVMPELSAHSSWLHLNPALFARITAVHDRLDELDLDPESRRLVEETHRAFVRAGAALGDDDRARLADLDNRLSALGTTYRQNAVHAMARSAVLVTDADELAGLDAPTRAAAAAYAAEQGHPGAWLFKLLSPTIQPLLRSATDRGFRERVWRASTERATTGESPNTELAVEIARLRAERAALLGHRTHADWVLADTMAGSYAAVKDMLDRLIPPTVAAARAESVRLRERALADGVDALQPWDWPFYAARVQEEDYRLDADRLKHYFPLERVLRDGVFRTAEILYGVTITERDDLAGYAEGTRVFEVARDGAPIGLLVGDWFTRATKAGGAWMNSLRTQSRLLDRLPVVVNNMNIARPEPGRDALLTFDEVTTLFHEFGHGLHGLLSDVTYPRFSGTAVSRDFVEFPSQVNEIWAFWPEVLDAYARHVDTGERLGTTDVAEIEAAKRWGLGFAKHEFIQAAVLDFGWHTLTVDDEVTDAAAFEREVLEQWGMANPLIAPRYGSAYFTHIFGGGYSAGYYAYLWAEVLDAHGEAWFAANGGLDRANGAHLEETVLSRGNARDVAASFRAFAGEEPKIEPLLERYGFASSKSGDVEE
ncbi:M3 family metallopeptidase [Mariniluteicoccus flavus]